MKTGDKVHYWHRKKGTTRSWVRNGIIRGISPCGKFARVQTFRCSAVTVESVTTQRLKEGWK